MISDDEFLILFLKQSDFFIKKYGSEGFETFYHVVWRGDADTASRKKIDFIEWTKFFLRIIKKQPDLEPLASRALIGSYVRGEKEKITPKELKKWIHEKLSRIAAGEDANAVFCLNKKKGERGSRNLYNRLMIVSFYEQRKREGLNKSKAIAACEDEFRIQPPQVYSFLKGLESTLENLSDEAIDFYRKNDVSKYIS